MRLPLFVLMTMFLLLVPVACNDANAPNILDEGWLISVKVSDFSPSAQDFPIYIEIVAEVKGVISGILPPDDEPMVFTTSNGQFENGQSQIEKLTIDGSAAATLRVEDPGSYKVSVLFESNEASFIIAFAEGH